MSNGYVYFAQNEDSGLVKIGFSRWPRERMRELRSKHHAPITPLGACSGSLRDEKLMHARFAHCRVYGEWFQPSSDLLEFAARLDTRPFCRSGDGRRVAPSNAFDTATGYARRHGRSAELIHRMVRAAAVGDRLPGGGIVVEDPEGRRWVEVDVPEPKEKTA